MTDAEMKTLCERDKAMILAIFDGKYDVVINLAQKNKKFYIENKILSQLSEETTEKENGS